MTDEYHMLVFVVRSQLARYNGDNVRTQASFCSRQGYVYWSTS